MQKKFVRRLLTLLIAPVFLLTSCSPGGSSAGDYPWYDTLADLAAASDLVVRLEVVEVTEYPDGNPPEYGDYGYPLTITRARVVEVLAGTGLDTGEIIAVRETSTRSNPGPSAAFLADITEPVAFLSYWDDGTYTPLTPDLALWQPNGDGEYRPLSDQTEMKAASYAELREIVAPEPAAEVHASWAYGYESYEELVQNADLIVLGTVSALSVDEEAKPLLTTVYTIDIAQVLAGEISGSNVELAISGGTVDDGVIASVSDPLPEVADSFLLFLSLDDDGAYQVLGGPQGRVRHIDGLLYSLDGQDPGTEFAGPLSLSSASYTELITELGLDG